MFVYLIYHTSKRRAGDFHIASSISTFSIGLISALFFSLKLIAEESYNIMDLRYHRSNWFLVKISWFKFLDMTEWNISVINFFLF